MTHRLVWLMVVLALAGCAGAPTQQTQSPAVSPTVPAGPTAGTSGQPTPPLTAAPVPTQEESGEPDLYFGGTITWTAQSNLPVGDIIQTQSVTGTAYVVIHVIDPYLLLAERDTGNTYSYDYANNYDCPSSHEEGTLESQAGVGTTDDWDYSIATLNPAGPTGQDLSLQILMPDYCGPSMGGEVDRSRPSFEGFPDCEPLGDQLFARFDGVDSYVLDCPAIVSFGGVSNDIGTATGHVEGTLSPLDGPQQ